MLVLLLKLFLAIELMLFIIKLSVFSSAFNWLFNWSDHFNNRFSVTFSSSRIPLPIQHPRNWLQHPRNWLHRLGTRLCHSRLRGTLPLMTLWQMTTSRQTLTHLVHLRSQSRNSVHHFQCQRRSLVCRGTSGLTTWWPSEWLAVECWGWQTLLYSTFIWFMRDWTFNGTVSSISQPLLVGSHR